MNWFEGGDVFSPFMGEKNSEISLIQDENGEYNIRLTGELRNSVYNYIDNYINYKYKKLLLKYSSNKEFVDRYKNASQESFNAFIAEMVLNYEIQYNNLLMICSLEMKHIIKILVIQLNVIKNIKPED